MSYQVRNPYRKVLQQQEQRQRNLQFNLETTEAETEESSGWAFVTKERVTDISQSKDTAGDDVEGTDADGTQTIVGHEKAPYLADPNQPIVTYSTRKPNYPTKYSCEHSLFYLREGPDHDVATAVDMLSFSEDTVGGGGGEDSSSSTIALNETPVRIALEFEITNETPGEYDEVISNVEALQWSLLHKISDTSGLSKGCKIQKQYDERTLVTALTNINERPPQKVTNKSSSGGGGATNDNNNNNYSTSPNSQKRYSNSQKNNRRRRTLGKDRSLQLTALPYPTSVYSIASTRPKWTASCLSGETTKDQGTQGECFTTQINFLVRYRGSTGESDLIEEYIQSIVHNQIALDSTQLFAEDITGLRWISNEEASAVFNPPDPEQGTLAPIFFGPDFSLEDGDDSGVDAISTPVEEGSNDFFASVAIPIATAVILGVIWYCIHVYYFKRRKNRRTGADRKPKGTETGPAGKEDKKDIESGSVSTGATRELQSNPSSDSQESSESKSCTDMMAKALGLSPAALSALHGASQASTTRRSTGSIKTCPVSVDSPERSASGLPPRPRRTVSKQLKKKRRKKKGRKKKQVLAMTRVSSRDNIVEMPIISESESENDSECDSGDEVYCDDGSSYAASSAGCSTPDRSSGSRSRTSSRASSPQKSPRDEVFSPSGPMDPPDIEFQLEAPEFSTHVFAEPSKKQVIGVDENLPPNLALRPKPNARSTSEAVWKPRSVEPGVTTANHPKRDASPVANVIANGNDRRALEIDAQLDLDSSFAEENGTVMERMLPLPWLQTKTNKTNNNDRFK